MCWSGLAGCAQSPKADFNSADPDARLAAIIAAGQHRDAEKIPDLIDQLGADDAAVRMFAIEALYRITGQRLGYQPQANPAQRHAAIERWIRAYQSGRVRSMTPHTQRQSDETP